MNNNVFKNPVRARWSSHKYCYPVPFSIIVSIIERLKGYAKRCTGTNKKFLFLSLLFFFLKALLLNSCYITSITHSLSYSLLSIVWQLPCVFNLQSVQYVCRWVGGHKSNYVVFLVPPCNISFLIRSNNNHSPLGTWQKNFATKNNCCATGKKYSRVMAVSGRKKAFSNFFFFFKFFYFFPEGLPCNCVWFWLFTSITSFSSVCSEERGRKWKTSTQSNNERAFHEFKAA